MTELSRTLADVRERVVVLEARLARKRRCTAGVRMTRLDRCPFGFRPNPKNPARLIEEPEEQKTIRFMIEAAQDPAMGPRALCRYLDLFGFRRREGKKWVGANSLVRDILRRNAADTPAAARLRVWEWIAARARGATG